MKTAPRKKSSSPARSSDAVDRQLARYRSMRNFDVTAEPRGGTAKKSKQSAAAKESSLPFVIQKHAATRLHYDFRLGWRGVLKSWAVTKGPSYYPGDKRLAVQVEDHPIEYGGFEGIIPKGQYGGGTVMLWDQGTWAPHGDVDEGLAKGHLKFTLHGKKLRGDWALVRMGGKAAQEKKPNWLLIKEHDGNERIPDDPAVTEEEPNSVVTGRDLDAIAANQDHVWDSQGSRRQKPGRNGPPSSTKKSPPTSAKKSSRASHDTRSPVAKRANSPAVSPLQLDLKGTPQESLPKFVPPQLATQVAEAPAGSEWIHELKLDGYRMQGRVETSRGKSRAATLITRGGLDWTHRMPDIAAALAELPVESALVDGEVVVFDAEGKTSFADLQAAFQEGKKKTLTYVIFDLLHLNGHNLRGLPLQRRKEILERILAHATTADKDAAILRYSQHLGARGAEVFQHACKLGAEGIVSKNASAPYSSSRSGTWLKIKCVRQQEFVIGGFTPPSKTGVGIGALLLGYYRDGKLIYAGRTGTGFTQKARRDMRKRMEAIRQPQPAFAAVPGDASRDAQWVQPRYVCEVKFATWTADNLVRQASFQGLREDKPATQVTREQPVDASTNHRSRNKKNPSSSASKTSTGKRSAAKSAAPSRSARSSAPRSTAAKRNQRPSAKSGDAFPIPLTHPDKQVDEESGLTKRELADYFWSVRDHMLPHIVHRPLSIVRCPQGSTKPCFFQKHVTENLPEGIEGIDIRGRRSGVVESYITLSGELGLAGLAQMGVLEIHPWGSSNTDIEKPDRLVFDLDPDEAIRWATLAESAKEVRSRLKQYKLESFLKTTGGKGLHVVAPIQPEHEWPVIKKFALAIASQMEADNKNLYLIKMTKAARHGKIFVDYLRNERGATSIAPFSPRARHGAPCAVPLDWKELDARKPPRFLVADFPTWKTRLRHDPWKAMLNKRQSIPKDVLERLTSGPESGSRRSVRKD